MVVASLVVETGVDWSVVVSTGGAVGKVVVGTGAADTVVEVILVLHTQGPPSPHGQTSVGSVLQVIIHTPSVAPTRPPSEAALQPDAVADVVVEASVEVVVRLVGAFVVGDARVVAGRGTVVDGKGKVVDRVVPRICVMGYLVPAL